MQGVAGSWECIEHAFYSIRNGRPSVSVSRVPGIGADRERVLGSDRPDTLTSPAAFTQGSVEETES